MNKDHIDRKIWLGREEEYQALYSWYIQEIDDLNKPLSTKLIPWQHTLAFIGSRLEYTALVESTTSENDVHTITKLRESLTGVLTPRKSRHHFTKYSMLGTDRTLSDIHLRIEPNYEKRDETCLVWGWVANTMEWDFTEIEQPDYLEIQIYISSEKFEKLKLMVINDSANYIAVSLTGVAGFYSNWDPSIRTSFIKILADKNQQNVLKLPSETIDPPVLGSVEDFSLLVSTKSSNPWNNNDIEGIEDDLENIALNEKIEESVTKTNFLPQMESALLPLNRSIDIGVWSLFFSAIVIIIILLIKL